MAEESPLESIPTSTLAAELKQRQIDTTPTSDFIATRRRDVAGLVFYPLFNVAEFSAFATGVDTLVSGLGRAQFSPESLGFDLVAGIAFGLVSGALDVRNRIDNIRRVNKILASRRPVTAK